MFSYFRVWGRCYGWLYCCDWFVLVRSSLCYILGFGAVATGDCTVARGVGGGGGGSLCI